MKRIWLDDTRPPPPGYTWVRTVNEVIDQIARGGVDEVSLDYNLTHSDPDRYGVEVLHWFYDHGQDIPEPPHFTVHSANPFGAAHMSLYIRALEGRCEPTPEELYDFLGV